MGLEPPAGPKLSPEEEAAKREERVAALVAERDRMTEEKLLSRCDGIGPGSGTVRVTPDAVMVFEGGGGLASSYPATGVGGVSPTPAEPPDRLNHAKVREWLGELSSVDPDATIHDDRPKLYNDNAVALCQEYLRLKAREDAVVECVLGVVKAFLCSDDCETSGDVLAWWDDGADADVAAALAKLEGE